MLLTLVALTPLGAQSPPTLITAAVNEAQRSTLVGNVYPLAVKQFDQGAAPPALQMDHMLLRLKRTATQDTALQTFLADLQNPASPVYRHFLTPEQFGARFGANVADIQAISDWLTAHGFQIGHISKSQTLIEFSGTASQVQTAFHTEIHKFVINGQAHWANANEPQVPTALASVIGGFVSLHNFEAHPQSQLINPSLTLTNGGHYLSPADFNLIYGGNQLGITGAGASIAIVGRSNINLQDVVNFRKMFGLSGAIPKIIVNGTDPGDLGGGEEAEAVLDTSWAGAAAPNAAISLVVSASTNSTDGTLLSEEYIINNNLADVMSESFSTCEATATNSLAQAVSSLAQQAAAQGITYVVSSGDTGSAGCNYNDSLTSPGPVSVNLLSSTPYTVAVGGTQFNENGSSAYWSAANGANYLSATQYIPEDAWNENCAGTFCGSASALSGGGGASIYFAKPAWQTGVAGIPSDGARDVPDVSLTAASHDAYALCLRGSCSSGSGGFYGVYGTSAAAPSFAGVVALMRQNTGTRMGQIAPLLYNVASLQGAAGCDASNTSVAIGTQCIFNDVTVGTNAIPGETNYNTGSATFNAGAGYDLATGLGSVNVGNLVNNLGTSGESGTLSFSAATLLFPGPSTTQIGTLTNTSNKLVGIQAILTPTFQTISQYTASTNCGATLNAGASCTIEVCFCHPQVFQSSQGFMTITSTSGQTVYVLLSGNWGLTLGQNPLIFGPGAGSFSDSTSNIFGTWSAATSSPWIHLTTASGTDSGVTVFSYDSNTTNTFRLGAITYTGQNLTNGYIFPSLTIIQTGGSYVETGAVAASSPSFLHGPSGVAVDNLGNVYVADTLNNAITMWTASTEQLTSLVTSGLNNPQGVAVDASGNVYISDTGSNSVKEWNATTQQLSTLVYSVNATAIAVDAAGNLYIADSANNSIDKWTVANQQLSTLVTGSLNRPFSVAVDPSGNVYIADGNGIEKWVASTSHISSLVSSVAIGGISVDASGNIYFSGSKNNTVNELVASSQQINTLLSSGLSSPTGLAVDVSGNVYIADTSNEAIKEWIPTEQRAITLISAGFSYPYGSTIAADASGNVYIADTGTSSLKEFFPASQRVITLVSTGLASPQGVAVDSSFNVYIADTGNNAIKMWSPLTNQVTTLISSGLNGPTGLALDRFNELYIADTKSNSLKIWDQSGGLRTIVSSGLSGPQGLAVDSSGTVYIADTYNSAIKTYSAGSVTTLILSGLSSPQAVAVDSNFNVYVADTGNNAVKQLNPITKQVVTLFASAPNVDAPWGITVDPSGNVYFADGVDGVAGGYVHALIKTLTPVFIGSLNFQETPAAGTDAVSVYPQNLPTNATSDQSWLTVGSQKNGQVNFAFTTNTGATRVAHLSMFAQSITVTQTGSNTPVANVSPGSLTFNTLIGTQSATQVVTLNNSGGLPLTISSISVNNSLFTLSNSCGSSLAVNASCTVGITFHPTATGSVTGTLTFTDNGYPTDTQTVTLTGSGYILLPQTIIFNPIPTQVTGTALTLSAAVNSGLTITYSSSTTSVCTVSGAAATFLAPGSCSITASQPGNASYLAATSVTQSFSVISGTGLGFVPLAPCRLVDTRYGSGALAGPTMAAASSRSFPLAGTCGLPAAASAYALNVTVVPNASLTYLTLWPTGQAQPNVSTLNSYDGRIVANAAIVPAGAGGAITAYVSDKTDVIIDINGYFTTAGTAGALSFVPVTPCRVEDTRNTNGLFGGPILAAGASRAFVIPQSACSIPASASAYSLNETVVPASTLQYLTIYPTGSSQPVASTLNSYNGQVVANATIVSAGSNGSVSAYVTDQTDLITDINGYFTSTPVTPSIFNTLAPCRVVDTRNANGTFGGPIVTANSTRVFPIQGSACSVPSTATAYAVNVTVVPSGALQYLTLWPDGQTQPLVSTLNSYNGQVVANAAIVPAGNNGSIDVFVTGDTHVIIDIVGYFSAQ